MAFNYQAFNRFQTNFFTSIGGFSSYTNYEINQNAFMLFNNITKAFPAQATKFMFYNNILKFDNSPSLIRALQHKYVNNFTRARIPKEIYFKAGKKKKIAKSKKIKASKINGDVVLYKFEPHIVLEIQSALQIDSKTYQKCWKSKEVQSIGIQIISDFDDLTKKEINKSK